ncbi:MAG TPA: DUF4012 domain-containing protein [Acidimicrobiales bacterium]|nr:DUF4012 domain-containing protein [Acidimicrobiales bacterium]
MSLLSILTAFVLVLIGLALVGRITGSRGTVDEPDTPEGSPRPERNLGGIPLMTATVVGGVLVGGGVSGRFVTAITAAIVVGSIGLLRDRGAIAFGPLLGLETLAAVAVVVAGIGLDLTGVAGLDVALTIVWIVGVATAFCAMNGRGGLVAGIGAAAAAAALVLAALAQQDQLAHVAGALAAACGGFALFNRLRPARVNFGSSGNLFVGFLLAVLAIELAPGVGRPASLLVPLLLVAVPLIDLTVVVLGRLRRRVPVGAAVADHLSDRLGARGLSAGAATGLVVLAQTVLSGLAVLVGRSMLSPVSTAVVAVAVLAVLLLATSRSSVYSQPALGLPRAVRLGALGVVVLVAAAGAAAGVALLSARGALLTGADSATAALNAARDGDYQRASALFARSERSFAAGRSRLQGPLPALGMAVPVVAQNVKAARTLADVGNELAASGRTMAAEIRPERLRMQDGAVPLAEVARIAPALRTAADAMTRAERRMGDARQSYLIGPVRSAVANVDEKLSSVGQTTRRAADAAELAPRILGAEGPRRYFLAIQNNAEARATGGFVGNYGELVAENGRISLVKFGSLDGLRDGGVPFAARNLDASAEFTKQFSERLPDIKSWLHVNITPDFPTVAKLMTSLYPQSGGQRIDGVISVDALGLAALMKLTGPVPVEAWPVPLSAENIVRVTTREQYEPDRTYKERRDFLGAVAETVWRRVSSSDLGTPYQIAGALGPAAAARHIQLAFTNPAEERLVRGLGIGGALGKAPSDSLMLVTHNGGGNKVDVYLDRAVSYNVRLEPEPDGTARVTGVLQVKLRNGAPASGLPVGVLGDVNQPIKPGENFSLTSLYSPLRVAAVAVDAKRYPFRSDVALERFAHSTFLRVAPKGDLVMQMLLSGRVPLVGGDTYVLDLLQQARLEPDQVNVRVELADGWEIAAASGLQVSEDGVATARLQHSTDRRITLRVRPQGLSGLWSALSD